MRDKSAAGAALTHARRLGGRYLLAEILGVGGMATVWRARDELLGRDVAVKVLNPQYAADAGFLARFEREARHAAGLSHPRLVTVFDTGTDEATPYIVMELLTGPTLRQVLDQSGALPAKQAVGVAVAVCEALEAAHAAGLVHRDIKPANIVLGAAGVIKVLDFGIAKAQGAGWTRTLGVLGTAAYLAPEQASGEQAGPQADLYSLGCVLYEMLTGTPPFSADSEVGLAYRQVHDDPGPPSARRPDLPARLDRVNSQLLAKDPAARPAGAAAARAALLGALAPDATSLLPPAAGGTVPAEPDRRGRWRPRRTETVLAAALAGSLIALAAVSLAGPARPARPAHGPAQRTAGHQSPAPGGPPPAGRAIAQRTADAAPPAARAAATFVGEVAAGVADGQVSQQAGQQLFQQLQQLLFVTPGADAQQVQQQYEQLVQTYDQFQSQGQITGPATGQLRQALAALGTAVGAL
jgi:serine/threonine-protein kinase